MPDITTSVSPRVHYRKIGSGSAVVLLHGFPESSSLWRHIEDQLAAYYTVIMPDFPGFGPSVLERETSIEDLAQLVKELLDHEGVDRAIIAGHSMGGYVALAFARLYTAIVAGLAIIHSTTVADDDEKKKTRLKSVELIKNGGREMFVKQMIPNLFAGAWKQDNAAAIKEQIDEALKVSADTLANYTDAMRLRPDARQVLNEATYPVLWVIGKADNIMPYRNLLAQSFRSPVNFVSFYQQSGHMSMMEQPQLLAGDLIKFAGYCYKLNNRHAV